MAQRGRWGTGPLWGCHEQRGRAECVRPRARWAVRGRRGAKARSVNPRSPDPAWPGPPSGAPARQGRVGRSNFEAVRSSRVRATGGGGVGGMHPFVEDVCGGLRGVRGGGWGLASCPGVAFPVHSGVLWASGTRPRACGGPPLPGPDAAQPHGVSRPPPHCPVGPSWHWTALILGACLASFVMPPPPPQACIGTAVHRRRRGGGNPPLLPFQCLRLTAKILLRRLRPQED